MQIYPPPGVIYFIEVGWNPAFCYARTVTWGAQALPPLLGEGETMMVVCPSLLICVEHDFLVEEHLCNYLPAFVVLDRISSSQVWQLGWLLQRNICISPFCCCSDTKVTFCQPANGNCLLTQAVSRSCHRFVSQDCKIASSECESWYASRRNTFSISPPTTNCLAAE